MLFGIGFLTVITAAITSTFVARSAGDASSSGAPTAEQLRQLDERFRQLDERLERIEAALTPVPRRGSLQLHAIGMKGGGAAARIVQHSG